MVYLRRGPGGNEPKPRIEENSVPLLPIQEEMFLPTALTVRESMDLVDLTKREPGDQYGRSFLGEMVTLVACPVCGKTGMPGARRRTRTIIHVLRIIKGHEIVESFCTPRESYAGR